MIRLLGGVMVVACGLGTGLMIGQRQKRRLEQMDLLFAYLDCLRCELGFTSAPLADIAHSLAQRPSFAKFDFAIFCGKFSDNRPFSCVFYEAAEQSSKVWGEEISECLKLLSSQLGTDSLEAQLSALEICKHSIKLVIERETSKILQNVKLIRTLSIMGSAALMIFAW